MGVMLALKAYITSENRQNSQTNWAHDQPVYEDFDIHAGFPRRAPMGVTPALASEVNKFT
jgi:hypothetical protein